jgi:hypothetical protein
MARRTEHPSSPTLPPDWFNLAKYVSARPLDFREWAVQIGNRFFLSTLLNVEANTVFDTHFARLIEDPFADLGFKSSYPSDKTVYPLTFGVAKTITVALFDAECQERDVCDEKLKVLHPDMFAEQAHLSVNLRAPKVLLIKQFSKWLETSLVERERGPAISESVTRTWMSSRQILPYQDLRLWHRRYSKDMPSDTVVAGWLDQQYTAHKDKDVIRATRDWADRAFTLEYYYDLKHSASELD